MIYHVLNGDALAYSFPEARIEGEIVVMREALIEGDSWGNSLQEFWHSRAEFLGLEQAEYYSSVVKEIEKIISAPMDSEFNLWFEYDLFCQVNLWFILSILNRLPIPKKVYAVYTSHLKKTDKHFWNGFGPASSGDLLVCFTDRVALMEPDLQLGDDLWLAYKNGNADRLISLASNQSIAFPYLQDVVKAQVDRFPKDGTKGRPEAVIEDIIQNGTTEFPKVFEAFWKRESIYGFGDTQLRKIYDHVMSGH